MTRIAVVNCNTTAAMTQVIADRAQAAVQPGTEIIGITPRWGVASAEGWFDSFVSAAAVLYELERLPDGIDGVVMAGFGEHGREGARELLDIPVVDITEAAAHMAMPLGRRFGIVTPLARSVSQIEDSLATAGLLGRCAAVEDIGLGVLNLDSDPGHTRAAFAAAALRAIGRGAEVICLGCAWPGRHRTAPARPGSRPRRGRGRRGGRHGRNPHPERTHDQQGRLLRPAAVQGQDLEPVTGRTTRPDAWTPLTHQPARKENE